MQVNSSGTSYTVYVKNDYLYKSINSEKFDENVDKYFEQMQDSNPELKNIGDNYTIEVLPGDGSGSANYNPNDYIGKYSYDYNTNVQEDGSITYSLDSTRTYNKQEVQKVKDKIDEIYKNNPKVLNSSEAQSSVSFLQMILDDGDGVFNVKFDGKDDTNNKKNRDEESLLLNELLKKDRIENNQLEMKDVSKNIDNIKASDYGYENDDYLEAEKKLHKDVVDDIKSSIKKEKELEKKSILLSSILNNKEEMK
jgi:hypothetical protein